MCVVIINRILELFTFQASPRWEELLLKANEQDAEQGGMLYNHVHQLHGLTSGTEHELTIESKNKFGWSRPLHVEFTTLPEGNEFATLFSYFHMSLSSSYIKLLLFWLRKFVYSDRFLVLLSCRRGTI